MPLSSGAEFAGFKVVRLLGSGGMGEVYLAQHPRLPRRDAVKVLPAEFATDPDYRARFEREADLASTLWHPHIVGVHDRGEADGHLWLAMDFVGPGSLHMSRKDNQVSSAADDLIIRWQPVSVWVPPKAVGHESENALSAASTHTRLRWLQPWVWIAD
jgi:serine/threonine protein kinase